MARKLFGIRGLDVETEMRGYYPRGGGMVTLRVEPMVPGATLTPAVLEDRGEPRLRRRQSAHRHQVAVKMRKTVLIRLRTEGYDCIATLEEDIKAEKLQNGIGTASGIMPVDVTYPHSHSRRAGTDRGEADHSHFYIVISSYDGRYSLSPIFDFNRLAPITCRPNLRYEISVTAGTRSSATGLDSGSPDEVAVGSAVG
ncbi:hypothetical protein BC937DRAFT_89324 [Endogone sp. FLAS-F59071]|nr:hypothetical protein BC937DRAFT_89324 [Endogone sp. FLAS-F59071]|eukprot:RUS17946.1 hypothetical protein BC937DRAFT_89324 [Endogone sp. FLAS-F59071]